MLMRFEDGRVATMDVSWSSRAAWRVASRSYGDAGRIVQDMSATAAPRVHRAAGRLPRREGRRGHRLGLPGPRRDLRPRPRRDDARRRGGVPRRPRAARDVPRWPGRQRHPRRRLSLDATAVVGNRSPSPQPAGARRDRGHPRPVAGLDGGGPGAARRGSRPPRRTRIEAGQPVVRRGHRRRRPRPPVRDRPLADPGRGDVPALRLVSRLQPDGRAVDDLPHPGGRGERPAPGDVHRARARAGRGHPRPTSRSGRRT